MVGQSRAWLALHGQSAPSVATGHGGPVARVALKGPPTKARGFQPRGRHPPRDRVLKGRRSGAHAIPPRWAARHRPMARDPSGVPSGRKRLLCGNPGLKPRPLSGRTFGTHPWNRSWTTPRGRLSMGNGSTGHGQVDGRCSGRWAMLRSMGDAQVDGRCPGRRAMLRSMGHGQVDGRCPSLRWRVP